MTKPWHSTFKLKFRSGFQLNISYYNTDIIESDRYPYEAHAEMFDYLSTQSRELIEHLELNSYTINSTIDLIDGIMYGNVRIRTAKPLDKSAILRYYYLD